MEWKDLLGATASLTTIGQFLSGMFTVRRLYSQGSVGDLSPVPFLMGTVGCAIWLIYGVLKNDGTIVNCNIVGTLLNFFYVLVFLRFSVGRNLMYRQLSCGAIFLGLVCVYVKMGEIAGKADIQDNLGNICVLVTILSCASPLVALKEVIRSRSTDTLPFPLILSMFLVCSQWWAYGVLAEDFYMQFTNFLGTIIALLQLTLFVIYPNNKDVNYIRQ